MPRGSHFLLLRQKEVTKEKATLKFALIRYLIASQYMLREVAREYAGCVTKPSPIFYFA